MKFVAFHRHFTNPDAFARGGMGIMRTGYGEHKGNMMEPQDGNFSVRGADDTAVSEFKSKRGLARIWKAFTYTLAGLRTACLHEHAFRQELVLVIIGVLAACVMPISAYERALLICVLLLVLVVELLNSAIEAVVDRVSLERHPLSKNAKDLGSAAVFLTLMIAAICWGTVVWQRFMP